MEAADVLDAPPAVGPSRWLDDGAVSKLDRLPRLAEALVDVAKALTDNFCAIMPSPAEVTFHALETTRVDRLLERRGGKPVFAIVQATEWKTPVALQFDQLFVAVVVHALFGGDEDEFEFPERPSLTPLETRIGTLALEQIVNALSKGFAGTMPSLFHLEPIRPKADPSPLGKGSAPMLVATFVLHAAGQPVELDFVIPQGALDPFTDHLAQSNDPPPAADPSWSEKLEAEINRARVTLDARLTLPPMTLGEIAALRPGHVLEFELGSAGNVKLACGETDLFRCELGQSEGCYSLRLTEALEPIDPSSHKDR